MNRIHDFLIDIVKIVIDRWVGVAYGFLGATLMIIWGFSINNYIYKIKRRNIKLDKIVRLDEIISDFQGITIPTNTNVRIKLVKVNNKSYKLIIERTRH